MPGDQLELPFVASAEPQLAVEYLTIAEAARRVRCCERTIRRAIDSGVLRAGRVRSGRGSRGGFRIRSGDVEAWMYGDGA
ncbi:MAG: helix-turn-helix domain-containing protein [Chloroflexi bacterium]|nr:helix-turn-helix domain-containing protein [Chloroflexota bacterium]